jgi:hypothetical protein
MPYKSDEQKKEYMKKYGKRDYVLEKNRKRNRVYYQENIEQEQKRCRLKSQRARKDPEYREKENAKKRSPEGREYENKRRIKYRPKTNAADRIRRAEEKKDVFRFYSQNKMQCKLCKEKIFEFLTVDHVVGRKKMGHGKVMKGPRLYGWLKKNNFPEGFQILCFNCNIIKELERKKKFHLQTKNAIWARNRKNNLKKLVMGKYGPNDLPECFCCRFDNLDGLSIDHIEGRTNTIHPKGLYGEKLWNWLKKNNFPDGFQTFCYNCNSGKGDKKKCPHEK